MPRNAQYRVSGRVIRYWPQTVPHIEIVTRIVEASSASDAASSIEREYHALYWCDTVDVEAEMVL